MKFIKHWAYKHKWYIQFIEPIRKKPVEFVSKFLAIIGTYYSFCEIELAVLKSSFLLDKFRNDFLYFLLIGIIFTIFLQRQKSEYSEYLGAKDVSIALKMANILYMSDTAIVIPTNTTFDTTMDGNFISENSIQGQFQKKNYGSDFSSLDSAIESSLDKCYPNQFTVLSDRTKTNNKRYEIGTVAKITHCDCRYYFLAVADVGKNGKPENVTMDDMTKALVGLWDFLSREGLNEPITLPVIGTGRAGLIDGTYEDVVHETIFSFAMKSQDEFVTKKMTVCIYPPALSEVKVTWYKLCNYLDLQCHYFADNAERRRSMLPSGTPIK